jgi:hypothetical protein
LACSRADLELMRAARNAHRCTLAAWSVVGGLALSGVCNSASHAAFVARGRAVVGPAPLVFGIYPGGPIGAVGRTGRAAPDNFSEQLAALQRLRAPGRPFVLHLFASYSGPHSQSAASQIGSEVANYTGSGFEIELVLTYRPANGDPSEDVAGYVSFVRDTIRAFGSFPGFVGLQITNEVNIRNAPNAADGYYAGAEDALVKGVIAAKAEARRDGFDHVAVGFNWAYALDPAEKSFWRRLGHRGGAAFRRSLDWVGLDVYPGTWGPRWVGPTIAATTRKTILRSFAALRNFMRLARLSRNVSMHVSENGFPTGPGRTQSMQAAVLRASIAAVNASRLRYLITDYRWFDLRDADSASSSFEDHYGLMDDRYTPKAAFNAYRAVIATSPP